VQIDAVKTRAISNGSTRRASRWKPAAVRWKSALTIPASLQQQRGFGPLHVACPTERAPRTHRSGKRLARVQKISGEISANLVNGKLRASDLAGEADLATVNGTIEANYNSLTNVRDIKLKSVNGSINLTLPPSPNAEVSASAVSGGITTDFPLTVKGHVVGKSLSARWAAAECESS